MESPKYVLVHGRHVVKTVVQIRPGETTEKAAHREALAATRWRRLPWEPHRDVPGGYTFQALEARNLVSALIESRS